MNPKNFTKILVAIMASAMLAACQTAPGPDLALSPGASPIDAALARAAGDAAAKGDKGQSLAYLEKIYKRNSQDPQAAVNYANALRKAEYYDQASLILAPFAKDAKNPSTVKSEFAAIQLALGNNKSAEQYAQKAVLQDQKNYEGYHYLGIALDAQGMHKEAERAYRKALDHWQGDPIPVMNNLALNLASQEYVDEAAEILEKAQAVAPDRIEIERNLRIVRTLQQSVHHAPKPNAKPALKPVVTPGA